MANPRRTRAYRGNSKRTSGSNALLDTVKNTLTGMSGNRNRSSRGSGLASQASGFIGGFLSGGDSGRGSGRRNRSSRRKRR
jgi:hypothetical protein